MVITTPRCHLFTISSIWNELFSLAFAATTEAFQPNNDNALNCVSQITGRSGSRCEQLNGFKLHSFLSHSRTCMSPSSPNGPLRELFWNPLISHPRYLPDDCADAESSAAAQSLGAVSAARGRQSRARANVDKSENRPVLENRFRWGPYARAAFREDQVTSRRRSCRILRWYLNTFLHGLRI